MSTLSPMSVAGRLDALRGRFDGFDALVVTTLPNVRYLTGFAGSAALLVVTPTGALLTTDGRYRTQSSEQVRQAGADVEITIGSMTDQRQAAKDYLSSLARVGLEADNVSWSGQRLWASLLDSAELVPTSNAVEALREVKDDAEIARMERAAAIADAALYEVLPMLSEEVTEEQFALELDTGHAARGCRGRGLRDDRRRRGELGEAPPPARGATGAPGRSRRGRFRCHLRGLPLGHDTDVLRGGRARG